MNKYFEQDPKIVWSRVMCPVCNGPTGPENECYRSEMAEGMDGSKKMMHPKLGILPVLNENCVFRQERLWKADINYPFSQILLDRIEEASINGLERIWPVKSYKFNISVGMLFDDELIKRQINSIFNTFIKEVQSKEDTPETEIEGIVGVQLPNGKTFMIDPDEYSEDELNIQQNYLKIVLDDIPESKGIFLEND